MVETLVAMKALNWQPCRQPQCDIIELKRRVRPLVAGVNRCSWAKNHQLFAEKT